MDPKKGERFLRKAEREACWVARDNFWDCMRSTGEDPDKCTETREVFLEKCPQTWVTHFDRKFQYEKFKTQLAEQGYQKLDDDHTAQGKK